MEYDALHILQRFDEVGLAAGIGAVDDGTVQNVGSRPETGGAGMGVQLGFIGRGDKAEDLFVLQTAEVLDAELDQHDSGCFA